jgi:alpha-N-arabinofuranosidase
LQVVNFGNKGVDLNLTITGLGSAIKSSGSKKTVLTSSAPLDENSFQQPEKVSSHNTESLRRVDYDDE